MGGFILFDNNSKINKFGVKSVFSRKGLKIINIFDLNNYTLWLYKKKLIESDNFYFDKYNNGIFVTGTLTYKNLSYKDSIKNILKDFINNNLDYNLLFGHYCIIIFVNKKINIISDLSKTYHLFTNENKDIISSSFLAIIAASGKNQKLNKQAILETLALGYTIPPDTIIKGIYHINSNNIQINNAHNLKFIQKNIINNNRNTENDFNIYGQLNLLKFYFQNIYSISNEFGIDIGLSGGYDSRLLYLLSLNYLNKKRIQTHTYSSTAHVIESKIAEDISSRGKTPLVKYNIKPPFQKTLEELEYDVKDAIYYYDGRISKNMGTIREIHTRRFREKILNKNHLLGLNGLGGELYRNFDNIVQDKIGYKQWMRYYIIKPNFYYSINNKNTFEELINRIKLKAEKILGKPIGKTVNKNMRRKYFGEIWGPFGASIRTNAENQLSFFLTPFIEYNIRNSAYKAINFIGLFGEFEAGMIRTLDENIANLKSNYGFTFSREPIIKKSQLIIKSLTSNSFKMKLAFERDKKSKYNQFYRDFINNNKYLKETYTLINDISLPVNTDLIYNYELADRLVFIASVLLEMETYLCF